MKLISYIRNSITYTQSAGREYFTLQSLGPLRTAYKGRGVLYSYAQADEPAVNCQLELSEMNSAEYSSDQSGKVVVEIGGQTRFPSSGLLTPTLEGYIAMSAIKLEPEAGQIVILMIMSPRASPSSLTVEKPTLQISNQQSVDITISGTELRCAGNVSGMTSAIILNRNPGVFKTGFNQILAKQTGKGPISTVWTPMVRSFEELVLAFYPSSMDTYTDNELDLETIADHLDSFADGKFDNYIVGDGPGVNYTLRLEVSHGLGRDTDETRLTVT